MFETKLISIIENTIENECNILINASSQRSKLEMDNLNNINSDQARQLQIEKFLADLESKKIKIFKTNADRDTLNSATTSAIQFCRSAINFFYDICRIYYQDINYCIIDTIAKLFKTELKTYTKTHMSNQKKGNKNVPSDKKLLTKEDIYSNICLIEKSFNLIETLYFEKTGIKSKFLSKVTDRYSKFRQDNFEIKL
jgi:hypothetical protein